MQNYETFPADSRVWIYQADRPFSAAEVDEIAQKAVDFAKSWTAHGVSLAACVDVIYNQFVRIIVDESAAGASGCSIDKSVTFIRGLEQKFGVRMLDGMAVGYRDGNGIRLCSREEFVSRYVSGQVSMETVVFNNSVETKAAFDRAWETPLSGSWHCELIER